MHGQMDVDGSMDEIDTWMDGCVTDRCMKGYVDNNDGGDTSTITNNDG